MFLIIDESGDIKKAENITDDDMLACDSGIISIVRIKGSIKCNQPVEFFEDDWVGINNWE